MYMHTHIPTCTLLPWCRLPGCLHPFRNFQHHCFDSAQHYLLLLCGHPGRASAWRTAVRQHCTCSQQVAPLRLRALHPTRAIIKEDRYLGVGEGSGCCSVCRQCEHLEPVGEIRAGERWWGEMLAGCTEVPNSLFLQQSSGGQHGIPRGREREGKRDKMWEKRSFLI